MTFGPACASQPNRSAHIAVIHVPKSAGTTLEQMLERMMLNYTLLHDESHAFQPERFELFVITTRDPGERVISAFNFNDPFEEDGSCQSGSAWKANGAE